MRTLTTVLFLMFAAAVYAQKLPNVQQVSLRAPADIKIDGKAEEWGSSYLAYNPRTEVYYTIGNDDAKLYVVAKVSGADMANRIVAGGLSVVIYPDGKKNSKNEAVVTFPTYDTPTQKDNYRINILRGRDGQFNERLVSANAGVLKNNIKLIRTQQLPGIDSLISVYNSFDIQAVCNFDAEQNLNLEIAIPLKYLAGFITANKIAYSLRVNGGKYQPAKTMVIQFADGHQATQEDIDKGIAQHNNRQAKLSAPTEFSAEYTLAK